MTAVTALHVKRYLDGDGCQDWTAALLQASVALPSHYSVEEVRHESTFRECAVVHMPWRRRPRG